MVEEEYFTTDLTTKNGTYAEGMTVKTGHAKIKVRCSEAVLLEESSDRESRLVLVMICIAFSSRLYSAQLRQ